jgi:hypothetical protein
MVMTAEADLPSLVAVMVTDSAVPPRTAPAVTKPADDTAAIASLDEDQVTVRPFKETPVVLVTDAESCTVCPYCRLVVPTKMVIEPTVSGVVAVSPAHDPRNTKKASKSRIQSDIKESSVRARLKISS